jgi:hypothetical protein
VSKLVLWALAVLGAITSVAPAAHADKITPSGPLRAYKGPEGEIVAMVEINDSNEMLVYYKNTGGTIEGKTVRYLFEDLGRGRKNVYINVKRGSKTERSTLCSAEDNEWQCWVPGKKSPDNLHVYYSEAASSKLKVDDVLAAYKP